MKRGVENSNTTNYYMAATDCIHGELSQPQKLNSVHVRLDRMKLVAKEEDF